MFVLSLSKFIIINFKLKNMVSEISDFKLTDFDETLKDFKLLLYRFNEVKHNKTLVDKFCCRNRNQIFDLTTTKYFKTGLSSRRLNESGGKHTDEHFIQRTIATRIIFERLSKNPTMGVFEFIGLVKQYASTIRITKQEHLMIVKRIGKSKIFNYTIYEDLGIYVNGLKEITDKLPENNY